MASIAHKLSIGRKSQITPVSGGDPYWDNVELLLHMDGPDGSTSFIDDKGNSLTAYRSVTHNSSVSKFGTSSAYVPVSMTGSVYVNNSGGTLGAFGTGDFTIELFVRFDSHKTSCILWDYRLSSPSNPGSYCWVDSNGVFAYGISSAPIITTNVTPVSNIWYHVAVSRSAGVTRMFLNGIQAGSVPDTTNHMPQVGRPCFGVYGLVPTQYPSPRYLDEVRVTKGVGRYTGNFVPPSEPFPNYKTTIDTYWDNVSLFLKGDGTNGSTNINDEKGNITTRLGNTKISTAQSKFGGASIYFDGSGDYLDFSMQSGITPVGTESFTIEGWIHPEAMTTYHSIFCVGFPVQIYYRNNNVEAYLSSTNTSNYFINSLRGPASSVPNNAWTHFALVRSLNTFTLYVNGVAGTQANSSGGIAVSSAQPSVGGFLGGSYYFNGYMDNLRITRGIARYTKNFTPGLYVYHS